MSFKIFWHSVLMPSTHASIIVGLCICWGCAEPATIASGRSTKEDADERAPRPAQICATTSPRVAASCRSTALFQRCSRSSHITTVRLSSSSSSHHARACLLKRVTTALWIRAHARERAASVCASTFAVDRCRLCLCMSGLSR